ncbi:MAG: GTP-binding protein [Roseburia sp.]
MIKIDLITGFLGAGKTTFLKKYARYLMDRGQNICILENDYGAVNVDMMLLQDLRGETCELEMVAGGCDADCHRRRFKTKLIAMGMCGYDRVLIEPSGIFDVDEFFDALYEEPLDRWYEIGNVITIVDARMERSLSREAEYLLGSQAASAGKIVLSHGQEATGEDISETLEQINHALESISCKRRFCQDDLLQKNWDDLDETDFKEILSCGYETENYVKNWEEDSLGFTSLYYMDMHLKRQELQDAVKRILTDPACGHVFRIKGFLKSEDGQWLELNATRETFRLEPIALGQEVIIVIGEGLVDEKIRLQLQSL